MGSKRGKLRHELAVRGGWKGRFFEDFEVGDVYEHPLGRTVTTTDSAWFTLLTQNTAPIHFDHHLSSQTEFGKPLVDSTFTVALVTGQSVTDVSQNVFANLGWGEIRLPDEVVKRIRDGSGQALVPPCPPELDPTEEVAVDPAD